MEQVYKQYSEEEHETWSILIKRIKGQLKRVNKEFLKGLEIIDFNPDRIPSFEEVNAKITPLTGWKYEAAPNNATNSDFFDALSKKTFLSSIDIRSREELEFCLLPDIFHDLFGHAAMLTDEPFCDFLEQLGHFSIKYDNETSISYLSRVFWYTAEVGLVMEDENVCFYGGSIISSLKEIKTVLDPSTPKLSYDIESVIKSEYDSFKVNDQYFVVNNLSELTASLIELKRYLKPEAIICKYE